MYQTRWFVWRMPRQGCARLPDDELGRDFIQMTFLGRVYRKGLSFDQRYEHFRCHGAHLRHKLVDGCQRWTEVSRLMQIVKPDHG